MLVRCHSVGYRNFYQNAGVEDHEAPSDQEQQTVAKTTAAIESDPCRLLNLSDEKTPKQIGRYYFC